MLLWQAADAWGTDGSGFWNRVTTEPSTDTICVETGMSPSGQCVEVKEVRLVITHEL